MPQRTNNAYRKAEEKIAEALEQTLTELNLNGSFYDGDKLSELPPSLRQLTQLQKLNVGGNKLTSLPNWLSELTQLKELYCDYNQLVKVPESLVELIQLENLDLSGNRIKELPESLGALVQLRSLYLYENLLSAVPKSIGRLTALKILTLAANLIRTLPDEIGDLHNLESLSIAGTQIETLPRSMANLSRLKFFATGNTPMTHLPEWMGQLRALKFLELTNDGSLVLEWLEDQSTYFTKANNRRKKYSGLEYLPESLQKLKLRELFLHGNPALELPVEILGREWGGRGQNVDPQVILAFYFSSKSQASKPLNEVKLLLVGHGRVGKTSLSKALRGVPHSDLEPETPGIERNLLPIAVGKSKITAHIWDFGGQEFLHQTHQFFFSERSIYVVVLTGRQGRPMQEAEYWLRLIRTYGTESPVVIVLNQIKAHPFNVDEHFLQENYSEVQAIVKTDCYPRFGIEPLRKQLGKLAASMPSVREKIDPSWARVRARLEEMKESFVTFAEYRDICRSEGVATAEKQETLATILDCLGIALNYRSDPRLRDTSVLKPRWLVDGIYLILRWLQKHETNGEMRLDDFPTALKSKRIYPPDMHKFLLALMEKFELCFSLDADGKTFLVPGLLNANQPRELRKFLGEEARRIQFRYEDVRPPGLMPRFIVRSHTLSERQARWQRGVVLARGTARALVRGDHEGRVTDVFALGEQASDRIWLTEFILSEMRILHDKLPVRTFVEKDGVWAELEVLRVEALRPGGTRAERAADGTMVMVDAKQTLGEIETAEASTPRNNPLAVFICYAHANERAVRQLIPSLKVLARRGYIAPWRDTDLVPGEDWDETIKERLVRANVILFMVSRDFLASKYITEHERPLAMSLMDEGKAVVVPVLLSPCSWRDEDFARLEKLPRKDDSISSFSPRDEAWFLVEEGLKKVVGQVVSNRPLFR